MRTLSLCLLAGWAAIAWAGGTRHERDLASADTTQVISLRLSADVVLPPRSSPPSSRKVEPIAASYLRTDKVLVDLNALETGSPSFPEGTRDKGVIGSDKVDVAELAMFASGEDGSSSAGSSEGSKDGGGGGGDRLARFNDPEAVKQKLPVNCWAASVQWLTTGFGKAVDQFKVMKDLGISGAIGGNPNDFKKLIAWLKGQGYQTKVVAGGTPAPSDGRTAVLGYGTSHAVALGTMANEPSKGVLTSNKAVKMFTNDFEIWVTD